MLKKTIIFILIIFNSLNSLGQNNNQVEDLNNGFFILKQDSKFAITKNQNSAEFIYDSIYHPANFDFLIVKKDNKWGVRNLKNKEILPIENDAIKPTRFYGKGKGNFYVKRDSKIGTVNMKNKVILPITYDDISVINEGSPKAIYLNKNNKVGIADFNSKLITPCVYDSIFYYKSFELIKVKKDGHVGLIDNKNNIILPIKYNNIILDYDYFTEKNLTIIVNENELWSILNPKLKVIENNIKWTDIQARYKLDNKELTNYDFKYVTKCYMEKNRNYR